MQVRLPFAIGALAAAFAGGLVAGQPWARGFGLEHDAHAQSGFQAASVFVPAEGLSFRAMDGRMVARLSYDAHGGSFEVFDGRERSAGALRAGPVSDASRAPAPLASPGVPATPGTPGAPITAATPLTLASPITSSTTIDLGY
jgi:hypothetical protein